MDRDPFFLAVLVIAALIAGCVQLPAFPWAAGSPDPVVGHWVAGEPPQTDLHLIFFENGTFLTDARSLAKPEQTERGTWIRNSTGTYIARSQNGNTTVWIYDASDDSVHPGDMPLLRYARSRE